MMEWRNGNIVGELSRASVGRTTRFVAKPRQAISVTCTRIVGFVMPETDVPTFSNHHENESACLPVAVYRLLGSSCEITKLWISWELHVSV